MQEVARADWGHPAYLASDPDNWMLTERATFNQWPQGAGKASRSSRARLPCLSPVGAGRCLMVHLRRGRRLGVRTRPASRQQLGSCASRCSGWPRHCVAVPSTRRRRYQSRAGPARSAPPRRRVRSLTGNRYRFPPASLRSNDAPGCALVSRQARADVRQASAATPMARP
jgi:hypothetical protein